MKHTPTIYPVILLPGIHSIENKRNQNGAHFDIIMIWFLQIIINNLTTKFPCRYTSQVIAMCRLDFASIHD